MNSLFMLLIFLPYLNGRRAKGAGKLEGLRGVLLVIASARRTPLRTTNVCVVETAGGGRRPRPQPWLSSV